jgi:hypothetical protein
LKLDWRDDDACDDLEDTDPDDPVDISKFTRSVFYISEQESSISWGGVGGWGGDLPLTVDRTMFGNSKSRGMGA